MTGSSAERATSPPGRRRRDDRELRLLVVEPYGPLRETIKRLLELHEGCCLIGEASNSEETLAKVEESRPDLAILDLNLPGALALLAGLAARFEGVKLAVLLSDYTEAYRAAVHARGAFACIDKEHLEEHLAWAIARARSQG